MAQRKKAGVSPKTIKWIWGVVFAPFALLAVMLLLTALGLAEECALVARDGELLTPDRQIWPNDELLVRKVASVG